jgi:hypothetical protein
MPANTTFSPQQALIVRLLIGLVFGLALAWLTDWPGAERMENWHPETWRIAATSMLGLGAFVFWAGAGAMRRLSLIVWGVAALALIAGITWHHAAGDTSYAPFFSQSNFLIYPFLFIAHELVSSGDQARKVVAPYATYFDEAWKRGVQLALAILFTGLFWAILWLGAALLGFIGFSWLKDLLSNGYFAWPVTGLAFAASVHLGDVQPKLMAGFRALVLPVITLVGLVFAASLCVSGLEPLWKTKAATASLLAACVALVLLINAAYQQGDEERPVHVTMKWSARLACLLMLVFSVLAAFSLALRIGQYGLTPDRVLAGVGVIIALAYGLSYSVAAIWPKGRWLNLLEPINIGLAFIKAAILLAVLTPVADPGRLSAESQAARLQSGKVALDQFDWRVLRYDTGTYGRAEVKTLTTTGKTEAIRAAALKAKDMADAERWDVPVEAPKPEKYRPAPERIKMLAGEKIPLNFLSQDFSDEPPPPACFHDKQYLCEGRLTDLDGDGKPEILLHSDIYLYAFTETDKGWTQIDNGQALGDEDLKAFREGAFAVQPKRWRKLKFRDGREVEYRDTIFEFPSSGSADVKFQNH